MTTRRKPTRQLRNRAHERVDAMADSLDSFATTANDYVDSGRERANEMATTIEDTIRERPVLAILIGAAVGFVFGCAMSHRHR